MMPFSFGKRTTARRFDVSSVLFLFFGGLCGLQSADDVLIFMMKKAEEKILQTPCYFFLFYCLSFPFVLQ